VRAAFAAASRALRDCEIGSRGAGEDRAAAHIGLLADAVRCARTGEQRCAASVTAARERFAAARLERRRVEALHARARADFQRAAERAEALLVDEANAARHNSATLVPPSLHN
jgi:flagellar biosynthesis chaperone FliJ